MKINAIYQLCKKSGAIRVFDHREVQWLGNGIAAYALHSAARLSEHNVFTMLDIPAKKKDEYSFSEMDAPRTYCLEDTEAGEEAVTIPKMGLLISGKVVLPIQTRRGIVMLNSKYLKPVEKEEEMRLFVRWTEKFEPYIIVKNGLLIIAVIMPAFVVNEEMVEDLKNLTEKCEEELSMIEIRKKAMEESKDE